MEVGAVVPLRRSRRHFGDVGAGHIDERDLQPVDGSRLPFRHGTRRTAVGLLHLSDPPLDVGFDRSARAAEVIDDKLRVFGVSRRMRQSVLRDAHRGRGRHGFPGRRRGEREAGRMGREREQQRKNDRASHARDPIRPTGQQANSRDDLTTCQPVNLSTRLRRPRNTAPRRRLRSRSGHRASRCDFRTDTATRPSSCHPPAR